MEVKAATPTPTSERAIANLRRIMREECIDHGPLHRACESVIANLEAETRRAGEAERLTVALGDYVLELHERRGLAKNEILGGPAADRVPCDWRTRVAAYRTRAKAGSP